MGHTHWGEGRRREGARPRERRRLIRACWIDRGREALTVIGPWGIFNKIFKAIKGHFIEKRSGPLW